MDARVGKSHREELEESKQALGDLKSLAENPGWQRIKRWADIQVQARRVKRDRLLVSDQQSMVESAMLKGEIDGIQLFLELSDTLRNQLLDEVAILERKVGAEETNVQEPDTDQPILPLS